MSGPLILVVEDNLPLLEGIRDLLEVAGYNVLMAESGEDALARLDERRPDLIVSDIMMPGMDGYQFYDEVRRRADMIEVPFVFLTARGEKADIRRGKELGADDYITKPFEEEDLLVVVRAKLARRKALEQRLDTRFGDLKRTILNTLSHEFRTPLTYVLNYSELLTTEAEMISNEEFTQFMQGIRRGAERLNKLVVDFITLVEIESGEAETAFQFRKRPIEETGAWLRVMVKRYGEQAASKGLELQIDVPDGLPALEADEAYLSDALGRLIDNAIKFSRPDSGWVRVSAVEEGGELKVSVADQGVGIRDSELPSVFETFHQIDRDRQEQQGVGSGLAICKGLVALHGGRVVVESEVGVGSTFTLILPLEQPAPDVSVS
jgi:two-component system sensor histidine kinase/response regulator